MFIKLLLVSLCFSASLQHPTNGKVHWLLVPDLGGDMKVVGKGTVGLFTSEEISFIAPPSCEGTLRMCYAATPKLDDLINRTNLDTGCHLDSCLITFTPTSRNDSTLLRVRMGHANLIATIDGNLAKQCPLKKPNHHYQVFNIVELPNCTVIVHGATLPQGQPKRNHRWLLPVCVTVIVFLLLVAVLLFCLV